MLQTSLYEATSRRCLCRSGLVPIDYLTSSTRGVTILNYWNMLKEYVAYSRHDRGDDFYGKEFERLADLSRLALSGLLPYPNGNAVAASTATAETP